MRQVNIREVKSGQRFALLNDSEERVGIKFPCLMLNPESMDQVVSDSKLGLLWYLYSPSFQVKYLDPLLETVWVE